MKVRARGRGQRMDRTWVDKGQVFECEPHEYRSWMEPLDNDAREAAIALEKKKKSVIVEQQAQRIEFEKQRLEHMKQTVSPDEAKYIREMDDEL